MSDIANIDVLGLEGANYIDLANQNESCSQQDAILFDGELGRIFLENKAVCIIKDKGSRCRISIKKTDSNSMVVWNSGLQIASKMDDLGSLSW